MLLRFLNYWFLACESKKADPFSGQPFLTRIHLKNRILVQDRGGVEFLPQSGTSRLILYSLWVEPGGPPEADRRIKNEAPIPPKGGRPKDILEVASIKKPRHFNH